VDDWAWRKGYRRYGTVLVDLKRRRVADLLPECNAKAVEPKQWSSGYGSTPECGSSAAIAKERWRTEVGVAPRQPDKWRTAFT
jgi:hypothetical protein